MDHNHSCQTFEILWQGSKTPQKAGLRWSKAGHTNLKYTFT